MDSAEEFTRLWTEVQPFIRNFVVMVIPDLQEAEDVVQNVGVAIFRKFSDYQAGKPFRAWATGFAKIELARNRQEQARRPLLQHPELLDQLAHQCEQMAPELYDRTRALYECIDSLGGRSEQVIRLRYEEACKPQQISTRLGVSIDSVRMRLSRARAFLRKCIESKLHTPNYSDLEVSPPVRQSF